MPCVLYIWSCRQACCALLQVHLCHACCTFGHVDRHAVGCCRHTYATPAVHLVVLTGMLCIVAGTPMSCMLYIWSCRQACCALLQVHLCHVCCIFGHVDRHAVGCCRHTYVTPVVHLVM